MHRDFDVWLPICRALRRGSLQMTWVEVVRNRNFSRGHGDNRRINNCFVELNYARVFVKYNISDILGGDSDRQGMVKKWWDRPDSANRLPWKTISEHKVPNIPNSSAVRVILCLSTSICFYLLSLKASPKPSHSVLVILAPVLQNVTWKSFAWNL